jgi:hypothetical protein
VAAQHELEHILAEIDDFRRSGVHDHALSGRGGARRRVSPHAFNLHDTEPAGAIGFQRRVIAEGGDFDSGLSRGLKNRVPLRRVHLIPVNRKGYFTHS